MAIKFICPTGHKLDVADELAGRKARCPLCRVKMFVPTETTRPRQRAKHVPERDEVPRFASLGCQQAAEAADNGEAPIPLATEPLGLYRPDPGKRQTVHLLAVGLVLVTLFAAVPAVLKLGYTSQGPLWARLVLLGSLMQLVYIAWMVSLPDWSTVWIGMLVFALVSTAYAVVLAIVMFTPLDTPLVLGLNEVRYSASRWCMAVLMLTTMMTAVCGRVSAKWQRSFFVALRRA